MCLEGGVLDFGDELEKFALFFGGERVRDDLVFAGVERWEKFVEDCLGGGGDVDEEFAAVVGVGHALDEPAFFEGVEQRGHGPGRDEESFGDDRWFEWLACAFDDSEDLAGAGRELVLLAGVTVVQVHEEVPGLEEVGEALGGERAGAGVFVFEVVADSS